MAIIQVEAVTKEPRIFNNRKQWGVKLPNGEWLSLECDFQPQKGMQFDVAMTETSKNGKTYKNATIIGPAPTAQQPSVMADFQQVKAETRQTVQPTPQNAPTANYERPSLNPSAYLPAKIAWWDWVAVMTSAWNAALDAGMPPAEAVAAVNTTLISYSNGKLDGPPAPPALGALGPPADDDIPF